jgi:uncharacterized protein
MMGWILRILLLLLVLRLLFRFIMGLVEGLAPEGSRTGGRSAVPLVRDPVCGTYVPRTRALTLAASGRTEFFCSEECRRAYAQQ